MSQLKSLGRGLLTNTSRTRVSISSPLGRVAIHRIHQCGNSEHVFMTASYVSHQRVSAGRGFSRVCRIDLGLLGDAADSDDGVCAGGRPSCLLAVSLSLARWRFGSKSRQTFIASATGDRLSVPTVSTLTHVEQRAGDDSHPSPNSGSLLGKLLWSSSLNKLPKGPAERC